jgi:hypothetical protein
MTLAGGRRPPEFLGRKSWGMRALPYASSAGPSLLIVSEHSEAAVARGYDLGSLLPEPVLLQGLGGNGRPLFGVLFLFAERFPDRRDRCRSRRLDYPLLHLV